MEPLLTIDQVAKLLNVSRRTVERLVQKREIYFIKLPGGSLRFKPERLKAWIDNKEVKPLSGA